VPIAPSTRFRQVRPIADQTPFDSGRGATIGAFGGLEAQAITGLGQDLEVVSKEAEKVLIQENERQAKELDVEFTSRKRQLLYGDGTEQNPGFYASQGKNTLELDPASREQLGKIQAELLNKSANGQVRRLFKGSSDARLQREYDNMSQFTAQQRKVANQTASDARIKEAVDDAALSGWSDPAILRNSESIISSEVFAQAEDQGWAPEVTQSKLEEARTLMYRDTIVAAIKQGQLDKAQEVFDKHKGKMDGPVAAEVAFMLEDQTLVVEAQAETDTIVESTNDYEEQLKLARSLPPGKLRDEVVRRVSNRQAEKTRIESVRKNEAASSAYNWIYDGNDFDQWRRENPEQFAVLASDGILMGAIERSMEQVSNGKRFALASDGETMLSISNLATDVLANTDLQLYRSSLTEQEYNRAITLQAGAKASLDSNSTNYEAYRRGERILSQMAPASLEWNDKDQSAKKVQKQQQITNDLRAFIASYTEQGIQPTEPQIAAEAQRLMTEVEVPGTFGFFFGGDDELLAQATRLSKEDRARVRVGIENIPEAMQDGIKELFQESGRVATPDLIEQFYGATLMKDVARKRRLLGIAGAEAVPVIPEAATPVVPVVPTAPTPAEQAAGQKPSDIGEGVSVPFPQAPADVEAPAEDESSFLEMFNPIGTAKAQDADAHFNTVDFIFNNEESRKVKTTRYVDSEGHPTIGVGFNLDRAGARKKIEALGYDFAAVKSGQQQITERHALQLFDEDVRAAETDVAQLYTDITPKTVPAWNQLDEGRRQALIDMSFNLGRTKLRKFKKMWVAIANGDWATAAAEAQNSDWFNQVGRRGPKVVDLLKAGSPTS
jgi:GH24 family phage-related lysozyme (muramidase)